MLRRALVVSLVVAGCGDDGGKVVSDARVADGPPDSPPDAPRDANLSLTEVALVPNDTNRDLDLLFIVDDSPSMLDKQTNLKNSFASFITTLSIGGLPRVHIGVITTDMGAKGEDDASPGPSIGSGPGACTMVGKDGALQTFTSTMITGKFISDIDGTKNYTGTLVDRFNEIASAGTNGCGFEQPLASLKRAVDPNNTINAGFLRSNARLGIVLLSDEDDCSMAHSTLLGSDTATLGPLQSFRCTRFGITCDTGGTTTDEMNVVGAKSGCHSNEQSAYLKSVASYTDTIKALKADPRDIVFGAIVGNTTPFAVELRTPPGGGTAIPNVARSCQYVGATGTEVADPAVRIAQVAANLPGGYVTSVCNGDLSAPMTELATRLRGLVGTTCIQQTIQQPAMCEAFDISASNVAIPLDECTGASTGPCFSLVSDATLCPGGQHLKVVLTRATPAPAGTWTSIRCAL